MVVFGQPGGWRNKIFWGDNLQVMSHMLKDYLGKIDLIYIDPPFDSKADYKKKIDIKGVGRTEGDNSTVCPSFRTVSPQAVRKPPFLGIKSAPFFHCIIEN